MFLNLLAFILLFSTKFGFSYSSGVTVTKFLEKLELITPLSTWPSHSLQTAHGQSSSGSSHRNIRYAVKGNARNYQKVNRMVAADARHTAVIHVKQKNLDQLEDIVMKVSNPLLSAHYGRYLSLTEVRKLTIDEDRVHHILTVMEKKYGFAARDMKVSLTGDFIVVTSDISHWEALLQTKFSYYQHVVDKKIEVLRTEEYSLPVELAEHVECIFNTVHFPVKSSLRYHPTLRSDETVQSSLLLRSFSLAPENVRDELKALLHQSKQHEGQPLNRADVAPLIAKILNKYVTPALLYQFYGIDHPIGNSLASQGVYETIGQTYSPADLHLFQTTFNLTVESIAIDLNGHASDAVCITSPDDCGEANLDVEYLMAIAQQVPTTYYYWNGNDFMVNWMTQVSNMAAPPLVLSISYGADEESLAPDYGTSFNTIAMKLAARGITITVSSGDDGAQSSAARKNPLFCGYHASFPASSPYVTAVGGTMGPESGKPEVACQGDQKGIITTGGGFSSIYSLPSWQADVVNQYLNSVKGTDKEPAAGYPQNGRGYPDVSLLAHNYVVTIGGNFTAVSGTSASSPVFAGMISLINSERLSQQLPPVGWINPALYLYYSQFVNDITSGDNHCTALGAVCCSQGYSAVAGWDAVTGLGSVNFESFKNAMMSIALSPTVQPVLSPTPSPTIYIAPTLAPSQAAGWLMIEQYSAEYCAGIITSYSGIPSNNCLIEYDSTLAATGSHRFSCHDSFAIVKYFSDTSCSDQYLIEEDRYSYGCAYKVDDYYYSTSSYSVSLTCYANAPSGPSGRLPYPQNNPYFTGKYAIESGFDSTTGCDASKLSSVDGIKESYCFNDMQDQSSYKINFPNVVFFNGLNCVAGKRSGTQQLPTTCESTSDGGSYGYGDRRRLQDYGYGYEYGGSEGNVDLYSQWSELLAPTLSPTVAPSNQPPTFLTSPPSKLPSSSPTYIVTSGQPTDLPSNTPPTADPTASQPTSQNSTHSPTENPSNSPAPTFRPSTLPTFTSHPSFPPTEAPSLKLNPSVIPTSRPSVLTVAPTRRINPNTPVPSSSSSASPTALAPQNVVVTFAQVLSGISYETWKNSPSLCLRVFANAIQKILSNYQPVKLTIINIEDISPSIVPPRRSVTIDDRRKERFSVSEQINITYSLQVNSQSAGFANDGPQTIQAITSAIVTSVSNGNMNTYLAYYASMDQVYDMMGVVSDEIIVIGSEYSEESVDQPSDNGSNSSKLNTSQIIWIAISVSVVTIFALIGGVYYSVKKYQSRLNSERLKATKYAIVDINGDSNHNPLSVFSISNPHNELATTENEEIEIELTKKNTSRNHRAVAGTEFSV